MGRVSYRLQVYRIVKEIQEMFCFVYGEVVNCGCVARGSKTGPLFPFRWD